MVAKNSRTALSNDSVFDNNCYMAHWLKKYARMSFRAVARVSVVSVMILDVSDNDVMMTSKRRVFNLSDLLASFCLLMF